MLYPRLRPAPRSRFELHLLLAARIGDLRERHDVDMHLRPNMPLL